MARRAWLVLGFGALAITLSMGLRQVFGLFLRPVTMDLELTRQAFGFAIGVQNLVWGLVQPAAGMAADRFGARRVVPLAGAVYVAGLVLAALGIGPLWLTLGVLVGIGQSGTSYAVVLAAVGRAVPAERRSAALGLAAAAGSIGMFTLVPGTQGLIGWLDWRGALLTLAAVAILMPLAGLCMPGGTAAAAAGEPATLGQAITTARRHVGYWMLNAGFAACGFQLAFIATYLPSLIADAGLGAGTGAMVLATIGLCNIVGTYLCGLLGGRLPKQKVLAGLYVARAVLIALFVLLPPSALTAILFGAAIGLIWTGTVPLTSGLVGDIFGQRHLGLLFGLVYVGHQLGAFAGAWVGGAVFDRTGSYQPVWIAAIVMGLVAAALHWPIRDAPAAMRTA